MHRIAFIFILTCRSSSSSLRLLAVAARRLVLELECVPRQSCRDSFVLRCSTRTRTFNQPTSTVVLEYSIGQHRPSFSWIKSTFHRLVLSTFDRISRGASEEPRYISISFRLICTRNLFRNLCHNLCRNLYRNSVSFPRDIYVRHSLLYFSSIVSSRHLVSSIVSSLRFIIWHFRPDIIESNKLESKTHWTLFAHRP